MAEIHRIEYNWNKGVEKLEEYQPGGYHPVMVGDVLHDRYHIVDKLGFGGYSTVWLARGTRLQRYVAVMINTANCLPRETKVLKALSAPLPLSSPVHPRRGLIPVVLDEFKVRGPNGEHTCYTVAPGQCNLREISFSRLFPSRLLEHCHMDLYRPLLIHIHKAMFMEVGHNDDIAVSVSYK